MYSAAIDVAGKAIDVAAEAGTVAHNAVKPPNVRGSELHHITHIDHSKERAYANNVPEPMPEKGITAGNGDCHKYNINHNLGLGKRQRGDLRQGHRHSLARHCHRTATDFEGNAKAKNRAPGQLLEASQEQTVGLEKCCKSHVDVEEKAKEEADDELKELDALKTPTQYDNLSTDKQDIHQIGVLPDSQVRHERCIACKSKHKGDCRNNTAAKT